MNTSLTVNGARHKLDLDPRTTLLDALREHLDLTGTKKGCDHGQCGACTVLVNGRRINSCLTLAVMHDGDEITTDRGAGHARRAVAAAGGLRRPRRLPVRLLHARARSVSATGMLDEVARGLAQPRHRPTSTAELDLTDAEIAERMSGNLCRCSAYPSIVDAIREAPRGRSRQ